MWSHVVPLSPLVPGGSIRVRRKKVAMTKGTSLQTRSLRARIFGRGNIDSTVRWVMLPSPVSALVLSTAWVMDITIPDPIFGLLVAGCIAPLCVFFHDIKPHYGVTGDTDIDGGSRYDVD